MLSGQLIASTNKACAHVCLVEAILVPWEMDLEELSLGTVSWIDMSCVLPL